MVWKILIQVLKGLKLLHDKKILHRDMKSANVFLFECGQAKLGDLNVSKLNKLGMLSTQTGTPYYAAPEVWRDQPYDHKSDIWSFGCVIYEMCALQPPFKADDMAGLFKKVLRANYPQIPTHFSHDMRTLIKMLLQVSPQKRPTCDELLKLEIVQKRIKKYFSDRDGPELMDHYEPFEHFYSTIKWQKKTAWLQLPEGSYE
jgi:NIMA (never in mitosis gene a)-related kinase